MMTGLRSCRRSSISQRWPRFLPPCAFSLRPSRRRLRALHGTWPRNRTRMMRRANVTTLGLLAAAILAGPGAAREFYVGGPVHKHDMEIVANYLVGIEMAPMTADMVHGPDVIH